MRIPIGVKYRWLVRTALVIIPTAGIVISFFVLPQAVSVAIAIASALASIILDRFVFEYEALHVMPLPSDDLIRFGLGSSWFVENIETLEGIGLILLFRHEETAQAAHQMLKAWNYGKVIDTESNITLRAIDEGDNKYSLFIYPGDRMESINATKALIAETEGHTAIPKINVAKFYLQYCFDYAKEPLRKKIIQSLPLHKELLLNVGYVEKGEIRPYSKKGFRLKRFSLVKRDSPELGPIEKMLPWENLAKDVPESYQAIISNANRNLDANR